MKTTNTPLHSLQMPLLKPRLPRENRKTIKFSFFLSTSPIAGRRYDHSLFQRRLFEMKSVNVSVLYERHAKTCRRSRGTSCISSLQPRQEDLDYLRRDVIDLIISGVEKDSIRSEDGPDDHLHVLNAREIDGVRHTPVSETEKFVGNEFEDGRRQRSHRLPVCSGSGGISGGGSRRLLHLSPKKRQLQRKHRQHTSAIGVLFQMAFDTAENDRVEGMLDPQLTH